MKVKISDEIWNNKKLHKIKLNKINDKVFTGFLLKKLKIKQKGIKNGISEEKIKGIKALWFKKKIKKEPKKKIKKELKSKWKKMFNINIKNII